MRKVIGTGLPVGNGREVFHSIVGSSKKILPINKEGIVLYIPVDSNYSNIVFDVSEKMNHGTRYGAFVTNNGKVGKGLQFDGIDDYVDCGNNESLNITNEITIITWVKSIHNKNQMIIMKSYAASMSYGAPGYGAYLDSTGCFVFMIGDGAEGGTMAVVNSDTTGFNDGNWHQVGITATKGSTVNFYVDGNADGLNKDISAESGYISNSYPFIIGANYDNGNLNNVLFNGKIDEVKIYNRVLSPEEVLAEYNREK